MAPRIASTVAASRGWRRSTPEISAPMVGVTGATTTLDGAGRSDDDALRSSATALLMGFPRATGLTGSAPAAVRRAWPPDRPINPISQIGYVNKKEGWV